MGTRNQKYDYEICNVKLKNVQCVKGLGITIASRLKFSQQCKVDAGKAKKNAGLYKQKWFFQ